MSSTYLTITIGPIYKTMQKARKTREAWIASYLFSTVMEYIIKDAEKFGEIILPAKKVDAANYFGAGIYPDRLMLKLKEANITINIQTEIIDVAIEECEKKLELKKDTLKKYLHIHFVVANETALDKFELKDDENKPIKSHVKKLNYLLDVKELNVNYQSSDEQFFTDLFDYKTRIAFYKKASFDKSHKFDSIFDITSQHNSALELAKKKIAEIENKEIEDELIKDNDFIKQLHKSEKYLAILRADGDNFGKVIGALGNNNDKLKLFSGDLVLFSEKAAKEINDFGGTIIYIGGDDILAFCPLKNEKGDSIFKLIDKLNTEFKKVFKSEDYIIHKVSMSYGLSLTYYKYPLNEALDLSYKLLFDKAKHQPNKNCVAFQLLQHSGQTRETILEFGENKNYTSFLAMLNNFSEKEVLLQSLTNQLLDDKILLQECIKNKDRLDGYFNHHYNPEEKKKDVKDFINNVKQNLKANYQFYVDSNIELNKDKKASIENIEEKAIQQMNVICKTINFLNTTNE